MLNNKRILFVLTTLAVAATVAIAEDSASKTAVAPNSASITATNSIPKPSAKQADAASKTAKFGSVAKTADLYKTALDAHSLEDAAKQVDKESGFKGTVAKVFEPRGGPIAIVNFDSQLPERPHRIIAQRKF